MKALPWLLVVALALLAAFGWFGWYHNGDANTMIAVPDTVRKPVYKPVEVQRVEVPSVVTIYARPDTALRRAIEKGPAIAGVTLDRRLVTVATIDTLGLVTERTYSIKDLRRGLVAFDGTVQIDRRARRRKRWAKVAAVAGGIVAATVAVFVIIR
jgi:hypothetical protein